ncbi:MAG: ROK family transcriptional regulator [Treponemataceae bacterium]
MLSNIATVYPISHYRIKDKEKSLVYQQISNFPPCSRKEVAEKTGIRMMTVSRVVQELIQDGLIYESEERTSEKRGRPEVLLRPSLNRLTAISLYLQSRELHAALLNIGEEILIENYVTLEAGVTNTDFIKICADLVRTVIENVPAGSELLGFALSLVGTVNSETKTWVSASRWHNISNLPFSLLEDELSLPCVVNRMQDAELEYLVQKTPAYRGKNVLFIHWGFGIGASYAFKGKVAGSSIGRFGEIGHIRVSLDSEKLCQCGAKGCLETEAALWALRSELEKSVPIRLKDEREIGKVFQDIDLMSIPTIERALRHIELALLNVLQIFYPDVVIYYGPFTENPEIFKSLSEFLIRELPAYARNNVEMRAIPGGFYACIRGSVYEFFKMRFRELLRVTTTKI